MKRIKEWLKRSMNLSMALLLIAILGVGMTMAYFTDIEAAINSFTVGSIGTETDEKVEGVTKTEVGVIATGTAECYVRMRVDIPTTQYVGIDGNKHQAEITLVQVDEEEKVTKSATEWNNYSSGDTIPAKITEKNVQDQDSVIPIDVVWKKYSDGFWYLSTTLKNGQKAWIVDEITYPALMESGDVKLPEDYPYGMLTVSITSEAVQTIDGIVAEDEVEKAYKTFQKVNGKQ